MEVTKLPKTESVGERIHRIRTARGLSQRQVADQCDRVSYAYISRLEAGARKASVRALRELAAALDVPPFYLEHGLDVPEGLWATRLETGDVGVFDAQDHPWLTVWNGADGDDDLQDSIVEAVVEALAVEWRD